jgi:hypothetical protein
MTRHTERLQPTNFASKNLMLGKRPGLPVWHWLTDRLSVLIGMLWHVVSWLQIISADCHDHN